MKKLFLAFICLVFMGCASKVIAPLEFDAGLSTLNNLSRGELNLACDDAKYLVKMFSAYNGVIFAYTAMSIAYPKETSEDDLGDDIVAFNKVNGEYKNFEERILAPYRGNKDAFGKVSATVIDSDVLNVFNASFVRYLGLMDKQHLDEYIRVAFCGEKRSDSFMSPADIDPQQLQSAILLKLKELKK